MINIIRCSQCGNSAEIEYPQFDHYFKFDDGSYWCQVCAITCEEYGISPLLPLLENRTIYDALINAREFVKLQPAILKWDQKFKQDCSDKIEQALTILERRIAVGQTNDEAIKQTETPEPEPTETTEPASDPSNNPTE